MRYVLQSRDCSLQKEIKKARGCARSLNGPATFEHTNA